MARRKKRASSDGSVTIEFLDVIFCVLLPVAFVALVSVIHINPPPKGEFQKIAKLAPSALYVQVGWQFAAPHDVDTHLRCKSYFDGADAQFTVNYRQKNAGFLDLIVDDLGRPSAHNHEQVMSNSKLDRLPPNTVCTLNVHLYSSHGGVLPIEGVFHVILNKDHPDEEILTSLDGMPYHLRLKGEEVTLMQLVIGPDGNILREATMWFPEAPFDCIATCKRS